MFPGPAVETVESSLFGIKSRSMSSRSSLSEFGDSGDLNFCCISFVDLKPTRDSAGERLGRFLGGPRREARLGAVLE